MEYAILGLQGVRLSRGMHQSSIINHQSQLESCPPVRHVHTALHFPNMYVSSRALHTDMFLRMYMLLVLHFSATEVAWISSRTLNIITDALAPAVQRPQPFQPRLCIDLHGFFSGK